MTSQRATSLAGRMFSVFLLLLCLIPSQAEAQKPKLTLKQISHLVQVHAPDGLVAAQVKERGINFAATHADIVSLTSEGAGPQTLAALTALIQTGSVVLHTEPGATVSLDGRATGTANAIGLLSLQNVPPGTHNLVVTKAGFHSITQPFTLRDREADQLSVPLAWAGGLVTIFALPATASISVTGPVSFSGPLNEARCPPGTYKIAVSNVGYVPQTESITLTADQKYNKTFHLVVDSQLLAATLAHAQTALISGNPASAIRLSNQVLSVDSSNMSAHKLLAEASFLKGDYSSFVSNARVAIQGGQSVTIPLMHVGNFSGNSADPVNATISSGAISFACSSGTRCKIPKTVNYATMGVPGVTADPSGTRVLRIVWTAGSHAFIGIVRQLDFVPVGSKVFNGPRDPNMSIFSSGKHLATPPDAIPQYEALISLLKQLRNP